MVYNGIIEGHSFEETIEVIENIKKIELVNRKIEYSDNIKIALFVFEKFYLRTNSTAAMTVFIVEKEGKVHVNLTVSGFEAGILRIGFCSDRAFIDMITYELEQLGIKEA